MHLKVSSAKRRSFYIGLNVLNLQVDHDIEGHKHQGWNRCVSQKKSLRPRQNGRHFADNIFKYIFLNENA